MERVQTMDDDKFSKLKYGNSFDNIIGKHQGRYYGLICYGGLENEYHDGQVAAAAIMGGILSVAAGGIFLLPVLSKEPHFRSHLLIVDKKSRKLVYYHYLKSKKTPTKEKFIYKHTIQLFKPYANHNLSL